MFGQDRNQLRQMYIDAWRKLQASEILTPLETMIAEIVGMHPEYHAMLNKSTDALEKDFTAEFGQSNPFMHMGMHIAIREQLTTDRPAGFSLAYKKLLLQSKDAHDAEHQIMECLGQSLWESQQNNVAPDELQYLECVKKLTR